MHRMNDAADSEEGHDFFRFVRRKIESVGKMRRTPEAKKAERAGCDLANRICKAAEKAESIEDLIHYEMVLQKLDLLSAKSPRDKSSVENAQRDYRQLSETIGQMRENPAEYFRANISFRDTRGDFRKLPKGRIQHISINVARMQDRAAFAAEDDQSVCEARIKLAGKTIAMLRAMHKELVEEREREEAPE